MRNHQSTCDKQFLMGKNSFTVLEPTTFCSVHSRWQNRFIASRPAMPPLYHYMMMTSRHVNPSQKLCNYIAYNPAVLGQFKKVSSLLFLINKWQQTNNILSALTTFTNMTQINERVNYFVDRLITCLSINSKQQFNP